MVDQEVQSPDDRKRLRRLIEKVLDDPLHAGIPMRWMDFWRAKVGPFRVVYEIVGQQAKILRCGRRNKVYNHPMFRGMIRSS